MPDVVGLRGGVGADHQRPRRSAARGYWPSISAGSKIDSSSGSPTTAPVLLGVGVEHQHLAGGARAAAGHLEARADVLARPEGHDAAQRAVALRDERGGRLAPRTLVEGGGLGDRQVARRLRGELRLELEHAGQPGGRGRGLAQPGDDVGVGDRLGEDRAEDRRPDGERGQHDRADAEQGPRAQAAQDGAEELDHRRSSSRSREGRVVASRTTRARPPTTSTAAAARTAGTHERQHPGRGVERLGRRRAA